MKKIIFVELILLQNGNSQRVYLSKQQPLELLEADVCVSVCVSASVTPFQQTDPGSVYLTNAALISKV